MGHILKITANTGRQKAAEACPERDGVEALIIKEANEKIILESTYIPPRFTIN